MLDIKKGKKIEKSRPWALAMGSEPRKSVAHCSWLTAHCHLFLTPSHIEVDTGQYKHHQDDYPDDGNRADAFTTRYCRCGRWGWGWSCSRRPWCRGWCWCWSRRWSRSWSWDYCWPWRRSWGWCRRRFWRWLWRWRGRRQRRWSRSRCRSSAQIKVKCLFIRIKIATGHKGLCAVGSGFT